MVFMTKPTDSKVPAATSHAERLAAQEDGALTAELLARSASRKAACVPAVDRARFESLAASFAAESAWRRNVVVAALLAEVCS